MMGRSGSPSRKSTMTSCPMRGCGSRPTRAGPVLRHAHPAGERLVALFLIVLFLVVLAAQALPEEIGCGRARSHLVQIPRSRRAGSSCRPPRLRSEAPAPPGAASRGRGGTGAANRAARTRRGTPSSPALPPGRLDLVRPELVVRAHDQVLAVLIGARQVHHLEGLARRPARASSPAPRPSRTARRARRGGLPPSASPSVRSG